MNKISRLLGLFFCFALAACGGTPVQEPEEPEPFVEFVNGQLRLGSNTFGEQRNPFGRGGGANIDQNLWRAAIETASVLPIARLDRASGYIETNWYAPPDVTSEQMRLVIVVAPGPANEQAVTVNAFRRNRSANGAISESPADVRATSAVKTAILNRAHLYSVNR